MFLNPYPLHFCGIERIKVRPDLIETHLYRFKDVNKHAYIIRAEKYPHNVYAIKFYLKAHHLSSDRYCFVTKFNTPIRILSTCLRVIVDLHKANPTASFVVVGANSLNEAEEDTKRYRVYKKILSRLFSPLKFKHDFNTQKSVYLLVNSNALIDDSDLANKIAAML